MKKIIYIVCCTVISFSCFALSAKFRSEEEHFDTIPLIEGDDKLFTYIIHDSELHPREKVSAFIVNNGRIYIFYDRTALVNVYTTNGNFEYGIQVVTMPNNGRGSIAAIEGALYIDTRMPVYYVFKGREVVDAVCASTSEPERIWELRRLISENENKTDSSCGYRLTEEGDRIVKQETNETIITLPIESRTARYFLEAGLVCTTLFSYFYQVIFYGSWTFKEKKHSPLG